MNGLALTRHIAAGYGAKPFLLEHDAGRGEIKRVRHKGGQVKFNPPLSCYVRCIETWQGVEYFATTEDERLCSEWELSHSAYRRGFTGSHSKTVRGAINSLSRHVGDAVFGYRERRHESFEIVEMPSIFEPKNTLCRMTTTQALTCAVHVYYLEREIYGSHFEEVALDCGRLDVVIAQYANFNVYEIKSCRADFLGDRKWEKYLPYGQRFSFVTIPGAIKPEELPTGVGLYYLNLKHVEFGAVPRRLPGTTLPLNCIVDPAHRQETEKCRLAVAGSCLNKGGSVPLHGVRGKLAGLLAKIKPHLERQ